jgi:hypothetical protein
MDSLKTWQERGAWMAQCAGCACVGTGDSELEAVKSLARGLRNRLEAVSEAARIAVEAH